MEIKILADLALGWIYQWVLFAPKKIPAPVAWGILCGSAIALWFWATPDAEAQFSTNWRAAVAGLAMFVLAAKGAGSTAKAAGAAPATDSK